MFAKLCMARGETEQHLKPFKVKFYLINIRLKVGVFIGIKSNSLWPISMTEAEADKVCELSWT